MIQLRRNLPTGLVPIALQTTHLFRAPAKQAFRRLGSAAVQAIPSRLLVYSESRVGFRDKADIANWLQRGRDKSLGLFEGRTLTIYNSYSRYSPPRKGNEWGFRGLGGEQSGLTSSFPKKLSMHNECEIYIIDRSEFNSEQDKRDKKTSILANKQHF